MSIRLTPFALWDQVGSFRNGSIFTLIPKICCISYIFFASSLWSKVNINRVRDFLVTSSSLFTRFCIFFYIYKDWLVLMRACQSNTYLNVGNIVSCCTCLWNKKTNFPSVWIYSETSFDTFLNHTSTSVPTVAWPNNISSNKLNLSHHLLHQIDVYWKGIIRHWLICKSPWTITIRD